MIFVKHIPQDTDFHRSFNVLVPLHIQGQPCQLIERGGIGKSGRTINHQIWIDGKAYGVPTWALTFN